MILLTRYLMLSQEVIRQAKSIEMVRESVLRLPRRSARKHAATLGISDRSLRRIIHRDVSFHPYKMAAVQKLIEQDWPARQNSCEALRDNLLDGALVFFSDESHFHIIIIFISLCY